MDKDRRVLLNIRRIEKGVEYANLSSSYNTLMYNYATIVDTSAERACLIEEQYNTAVKHEGIDPELHIQYHHVNEKLETSLRNYYSSYKTFLNAYIIVLRYHLPVELQKKLTGTSSVNKYILQYQKYLLEVKQDDRKKKTLLQLLSKLKKVYRYSDFRSISIEHPQMKGKKNINSLISDGNSASLVHIDDDEQKHQDNKQLRESLSMENNDKPHINLTVAESEFGSDVYVHAQPYAFKEGDVIKAGSPILEWYEPWVEHSKEFGCHGHFFPDKKNNPNVLDIGQIDFESPNIEEMKKNVRILIMATFAMIRNHH